MTEPRPALRVLDLTDDTMAYAGRLLADLGAQVVRVRPPGDRGRRRADARHYFHVGIDTVTVDPHRGDAQQILLDLCRGSDVVIEGLAPFVADPAGLREAARKAAPRLVWVAIREVHPGVAHPPIGGEIARYARSGLMAITGDPSGPPLVAGGGLPDAIVAAYAALAALLGARAAQTGGGRLIWVSAHEALVSFMPQGLMEAALTGRVVRRAGGRHGHIAMAGALPCRDGYAVISANERGMWRALVETIGDPRLRDPALDDERERMRRQAELFAIVGEWTAGYGRAELCDLLQARQIPVAPVHDPLDVARDPHLHARRFFSDGGVGAVAALTPPWVSSRHQEFETGRTLPELRAGPFTLADFVRWAGYQENWIRIHYDGAHATGGARLTGPVQSGNHRAALLLRMLTDWLDRHGHVRKLSVRHVAPVHVGDALTCGGRIVAATPGAGGALTLDLELWARTDDGKPVSEGMGVVEVAT